MSHPSSVLVPPAFATALRKAQRKAKPVTINAITLTPPSQGRRYWRLDFKLHDKRSQPSGGASVETAYTRYMQAQQEIERAERVARGIAERADLPLTQVIDDYIKRRGPEGRWKPKTVTCRTSDFKALREIAEDGALTCIALNAAHLRQALTNGCGTAVRAKTVQSVLSTFVAWGAQTGHFTPEQAQLMSSVRWMPKDPSYKPAASRRQQSERLGALVAERRGEVPTHPQVAQFAKEVQQRYTHGEGLIHVAANTGLRIGELLVLTADADVAERFLGNWVDTDANEVHVKVQIDEKGHGRRPTKTNGHRSVTVPALDRVATGFDVRRYLAARSASALEEQQSGTNPHALLFPSPQGRFLRYDNFHTRVVQPACVKLGWLMEASTDALGKQRRLSRFTLHSLRDRFAITALDEWGYAVEWLKVEGGWADASTIYRFYVGTTDETKRDIRRKHAGLS